MKWNQYGTGGGGYTVEQVEAVARSLEDNKLVEYSTMWHEAVRQMRAAEIIHNNLGVGAEVELPNGMSIYIESESE
uniref:Uncharacterized protein n=1 Tax=Siphoviridae sp. ctLfk13 TaxID=2826251 RepID=A0A8S5N207_9CAUD|nr:MAG TPA: hypothetical protein [Siphoviridae sp. ctLfk13]